MKKIMLLAVATNELVAGCMNTEIPEGITSIGSLAFAGCSELTKLNIPQSVTFIHENALSGCLGLMVIESDAAVPPEFDGDLFADVDTDSCELYVPKGSKEAYQKAAGWKEFKNIIER